jgi:hypothetical protein
LIPMFPMYLSISNKAGTGHRLLPLNNILHIQLKTHETHFQQFTHCSGMFRSHL